MSVVTEEQPEAQQTLKTWLRDLPRYAKGCLVIRTKKAQMIPLRFNAAQRIVHERLTKQRKEQGRVRAIILKARQEGVSTYVAARYFRAVHLRPNIEALVIADERKRGAKLFDIYERFDRNVPDELRPMRRFKTKSRQLVYDNPTHEGPKGLGSSISVETAMDAEAGRASTVNLVHVSELAFWDKPEETWVALMQAVPDDDSEVIVESTASGVGNFFHQMWEMSLAGETGFVPIFLPWWIHEEYIVRLTPKQRDEIAASDDPWERKALDKGIELDGVLHRLRPEQLAWRRRAIRERFNGDERAFRQEYPATADEAFLVSGNCFFDEDKLARYRASSTPPIFRANVIEHKGGFAMPRAEKGYLRVWAKPELMGFYVIFADTASGKMVGHHDYGLSEERYERGGRDFSCADVYDVRKRAFVAQLHGRMDPEVFAHQLFRLGFLYSCEGPPEARALRVPALIGVERNHSSGETVLRVLKEELRYSRLYYHRLMNRRQNRLTPVLGWVTNAETRMPMLDELARVVREESCSLPNGDTIREMFTFVRGEDGKPAAQEGAHDDRVISAAGALQMAQQVRVAPVMEFPQAVTAESPTGWGAG